MSLRVCGGVCVYIGGGVGESHGVSCNAQVFLIMHICFL